MLLFLETELQSKYRMLPFQVGRPTDSWVCAVCVLVFIVFIVTVKGTEEKQRQKCLLKKEEEIHGAVIT